MHTICMARIITLDTAARLSSSRKIFVPHLDEKSLTATVVCTLPMVFHCVSDAMHLNCSFAYITTQYMIIIMFCLGNVKACVRVGYSTWSSRKFTNTQHTKHTHLLHARFASNNNLTKSILNHAYNKNTHNVHYILSHSVSVSLPDFSLENC